MKKRIIRKKPNPNKEKIVAIFLSIVLIILLVFSINSIKNSIQLAKNLEAINNGDTNNVTIESTPSNTTKQDIENDINTKQAEQLKENNADERTRMQEYVGRFVNYISTGNYSNAYDLLYPEFKNNYFKTLDDFTNYCKSHFPSSFVTVEYSNFERQGKYYFVFTKISSVSSSTGMEQKFILMESDYNKYYISFDVKQ